jgi:peptidoglycan/xylan/chitin deacetylase (PgdA/CDA1 family)
MKLVVTVDTEEDGWGMYKQIGHTVENVREIPRLQKLFDSFSVKPTYLITYPVATNNASLGILKRIHEAGKCEIGSHCHPWNTPPFTEEMNERNSMLCNLSASLQREKIEHLHAVIMKNFGIDPKVFRTGRWGYDDSVGLNLHRLNYAVDTSVTPFHDWLEDQGPDFSNAPVQPYRIHFNGYANTRQDCSLLEIPVSVGFLQKNQAFSHFVWKVLKKNPMHSLHLPGILRRMRLLNLVWLSPELHTGGEIISLCKTLAKRGHTLLNMTLHSTSLIPRISPLTRDEHALKSLYEKLEDFLRFAAEQGIVPVTLSDAARDYGL